MSKNSNKYHRIHIPKLNSTIMQTRKTLTIVHIELIKTTMLTNAIPTIKSTQTAELITNK